ncbi:hypothetical protein P3T73_18355 [Kiritimatiellota bacterium B12222]|nr:hypothetical protein P3T73_18355 [Kiritimatiellota bacterium B12222]
MLSKQNPLFKNGAVIFGLLGLVFGWLTFKPVQVSDLEDQVALDHFFGEKFGEIISDSFPEGGTVVVIQLRPGDPDLVMQAIPEAQIAGLTVGLGEGYRLALVDATWVGRDEESLAGGLTRYSRDFRQMLQGNEDAIAVVSFAGLPKDPQNLGKDLLPPFYALMDDVLPIEWAEQLPPGIMGIISIRPEGSFNFLPASRQEVLTYFEQNFILTQGDA